MIKERIVLCIALLVALASPAGAQGDQGTVIFHRADDFGGKAIRFNIEQDGRPIGQLLAGSELRLDLDPGTYTFTVRAPSIDGMDYLTLTVESGVTYSVEGEIRWGWPVGRPKFKNVVESGVATPSTAAATPAPESSPVRPAQIAPVPAGNVPGGRDAVVAGLRNFAGDWNISMWSLAADGRKLAGQGRATGAMFGDLAVHITVDEFVSPEMPDAVGDGVVRIGNHPERGLTLETDLPAADSKLRLSGQFNSGTYVFYLVGGGGSTITGVPRSSVRIEIRSIDGDSWEAATFASVDGETIQVQETRFTRR